MARQPPLLPSETLRRVLRMARFDGISVLMLSGLFALVSASGHDVLGAAFGLAVAAGGAIELHGAGLLGQGEKRGVNWLVMSQLFVLGLVLGWSLFWLEHPDLGMLRDFFVSFYTPDELSNFKQIPDQMGMSHEAALRMLYSFMCGTCAVATLIYQGGMALYYRRRRKAVVAALQES